MMPDWMHDPDALALLAASKANPLEKTIRYILADKIQELGDEEVAIAIRKSMSTDRWGGRDKIRRKSGRSHVPVERLLERLACREGLSRSSRLAVALCGGLDGGVE